MSIFIVRLKFVPIGYFLCLLFFISFPQYFNVQKELPSDKTQRAFSLLLSFWLIFSLGILAQNKELSQTYRILFKDNRKISSYSNEKFLSKTILLSGIFLAISFLIVLEYLSVETFITFSLF